VQGTAQPIASARAAGEKAAAIHNAEIIAASAGCPDSIVSARLEHHLVELLRRTAVCGARAEQLASDFVARIDRIALDEDNAVGLKLVVLHSITSSNRTEFRELVVNAIASTLASHEERRRQVAALVLGDRRRLCNGRRIVAATMVGIVRAVVALLKKGPDFSTPTPSSGLVARQRSLTCSVLRSTWNWLISAPRSTTIGRARLTSSFTRRWYCFACSGCSFARDVHRSSKVPDLHVGPASAAQCGRACGVQSLGVAS